MNIKNALKYIGIGILAIFIVGFLSMGLVLSDIASSSATDSKMLNSTSSAKALIVYAPGITGEAKETAMTIGKDLQNKGYSVNIAGIKSDEAKDASDYDIVIVGGPIYAGKLSSSTQEYIESVKVGKNTTIAVFSVGLLKDDVENDEVLEKELLGNKIKTFVKFISGEDSKAKSLEFINKITV